MSSRVFRYEVPLDGLIHTLPLFGNPLGVACRRFDGPIEFWAIHHDDSKAALAPQRRFTVVGTGDPLPEDWWRHWGFTAVGGAVWHLIELSSHGPDARATPSPSPAGPVVTDQYRCQETRAETPESYRPVPRLGEDPARGIRAGYGPHTRARMEQLDQDPSA